MFELPNMGDLPSECSRCKKDLYSSKQVIKQTGEKLKEILRYFIHPGKRVEKLYEIRTHLWKQLQIYEQMNLFHSRGKVFYGKFWVPK